MKRYIKQSIIISFTLVLLCGCDKEDNKLPIVVSKEIDKIVHNSAIFLGNVNDMGNSFVFRCGVYISKTEDPTIEDIVLESSSDGTGTFTCAIVNLEPNTTYYVRAFAENNYGFSYGNVLSFTSSDVEWYYDERDGNSYSILELGDMKWFGDNLRYEVPGSSYNIDVEINDVSKFGLLYPYEIAEEVCPNGWHLPTDEEWKELELFLGMDNNELDHELIRGTNEGNLLKMPGDRYWNNGNDNATNEVGFSSYPAGNVSTEGVHQNLGDAAFYWTSTNENGESWTRYLRGNLAGIGRKKLDTSISCSIRCVKD